MIKRIAFGLVAASLSLVAENTVLAAQTAAAKRPAQYPLPKPQPGESWQPGVHYTILIPGDTPEVPEGKIELVELFMYTSGLSKRLQPHLQSWLKAHPNVHYVRKPSIVFPHAREQARMYYTLKEMGREDLHEKFFDFIRAEDRYPVYHTIRHPAKEAMLDMNLQFAGENGMDRKKFTDVYLSRDIDDLVVRTEIDTHGYHVRGTSTLVVNGKYSTSVQRLTAADPNHGDEVTDADYERLLKLIAYLVDSEAANASTAKKKS